MGQIYYLSTSSFFDHLLHFFLVNGGVTHLTRTCLRDVTQMPHSSVDYTTHSGMHLGCAIAGIPPYSQLGCTLKDVQRHKWRKKNKAFGPPRKCSMRPQLTRVVIYKPANKRKLTTSAFHMQCESAFYHSPTA